MYKKAVTMIEFEDGSGQTFNFRLEGVSKMQFINLKNVKYGNE